ncbi:MAG: PAS domain S-box protein [Pseudomonadota bacterium]
MEHEQNDPAGSDEQSIELLRRLLLEAEERYRDFVEYAHEIMIILDSRGMITRVNRAFERLLGVPRAEATGRNFGTFVTGMPDATVRTLHDILWEKGSVVVSAFLRTASGETLATEVTATSMSDDTGKMLGGRIVARPMVDRADGVINLIRRDRLATMSELISGAVGDIATPLTVMLGNVEALLQEEVTGRRREQLDEAFVAGNRIRKVLDDLRVFARSRATDQVVVDLEEIVSAATAVMGERFSDASVRVVRDRAGQPMPIRVDPTMLQQAIGAILEKALARVGARPRYRMVWISTRLELGIARLEVADNAPEGEGSAGGGMALSVASGVVGACGGQLFASGTRRKGNAVVVLLPLSDTCGAAEPPA